MNSRLTLLFVSNQPDLYLDFIAEFKSASFQVLIGRNVRRAKAILLTQSVNAIILLHDVHCDDRALAPQLKRMAPGVPLFLYTDHPQQSLPADIDSIWLYECGDAVVTRSMAIFCRNLFKPTPAFCRVLAPKALASAFAVPANDSN